MKIGKYEFLITKEKRCLFVPTSKTALTKWLMKNIVLKDTTEIIIKEVIL